MPQLAHAAAGSVRPQPTPSSIVADDGTVHTGWFEAPFARVNLFDAPVRHALSGLRDGPLGGAERRWRACRLKRWHYTSLAHDDFFFGCAIVHAGFLGKVFVYLVERGSGAIHEWERTIPGARGVEMAANSVDGATRYVDENFGTLELANDAASGTRHVRASLQATRHAPALELDLSIADDGQDPPPVAVVEAVADRRWIYTHKCYALRAGGTVRCGELDVTAALGEVHAGLDWNYGFRSNSTYWNWAAGCGLAQDGRRIGFNLTTHAKRPGEAHDHADEAADCALWIGREVVKLPRVHFLYDRDDVLGPWRVRDDEGLVDLAFAPAGERRENIQLGLMASRFRQPYGPFSGKLKTRDGDEARLAGVWGVTEEHFARW